MDPQLSAFIQITDLLVNVAYPSAISQVSVDLQLSAFANSSVHFEQRKRHIAKQVRALHCVCACVSVFVLCACACKKLLCVCICASACKNVCDHPSVGTCVSACRCICLFVTHVLSVCL